MRMSRSDSSRSSRLRRRRRRRRKGRWEKSRGSINADSSTSLRMEQR